MSDIIIQDFIKQAESEKSEFVYGLNNNTDYRIIIDVPNFQNYKGRHDDQLKMQVMDALQKHFKKRLSEDYPVDLFNAIMKQFLFQKNTAEPLRETSKQFYIVEQPSFVGIKDKVFVINSLKTDITFKPNDNLLDLADKLYQFIIKHMDEMEHTILYFLRVEFAPFITVEDFSNCSILVLRIATTK